MLYYGWERYADKHPEQNCLINGYFIKIPELRAELPDWVDRMIKKYYHDRAYAKSQDGLTRNWRTYNVYVPECEFPPKFIFHYNLNPEVTLEQKTLEMKP